MSIFQATFTLPKNLILEKGIQPLPGKIITIKNLAIPRNIDKLHHFLGLTGYYWKFIPLLADITKPLNKLLQKDTQCWWSTQYQASFDHLKSALCRKPILQYPNTNKPYTMLTDASSYAFYSLITEEVDDLNDLRPIAYTSGSFSDMHQWWSATEKEAFTVYQSILKLYLYLRGTECILHYNHTPLEPVLLCSMIIPKFNNWSMELSDYNLNSIHIKDSNNILEDSSSILMTLDIYKEPLSNPKTSDTMTCIVEMVAVTYKLMVLINFVPKKRRTTIAEINYTVI